MSKRPHWTAPLKDRVIHEVMEGTAELRRPAVQGCGSCGRTCSECKRREAKLRDALEDISTQDNIGRRWDQMPEVRRG